ncbi:FtsX-like permease family protein [Streptomyces sp. NPDC001380]|uniref:FtsX-like permease family protein n=1 Tax=Streptomyces sp. NPDC001380 TaxID=3364566 RepID=UPI003692F9C1
MWLDTGAASRTGEASGDPLWWWPHGDYYDGRSLTEVDVAATGPASPVPPGPARLPAPGEYYASPAPAGLIRDTPAGQPGDRFPGRFAGAIGDAALPSPDSLIAVIGRTPDAVKGAPTARTVTSIATARPPTCDNACWDRGVRDDAMMLVLSVVAGALIFPVLVFIGTATRLSAATREQRYAAMRLVGATPRQVSLVAAVESALAAAAGTPAGFALYAALRPRVAAVPLTGQRFFLSDLTLGVPQALVHAGTGGTGGGPAGPGPDAPALVACADLARTPMVGRCPAGAGVAAVDRYAFLGLESHPDWQWPAAGVGPDAVNRLPVQPVYVATDGSTPTMERVRRLLTVAYPHRQARTVGDFGTDLQQQLAGWRQLADVVLLTTLPIAGCSLAVSVVAGLSDRRRPFAILSLAGAPLRLLQTVVGLESALPLLEVSAAAIGTAFAASEMFLTSQMHYDLVLPDAAYCLLVSGGLAAALGIIGSTLPRLGRMTGPEAARNG